MTSDDSARQLAITRIRARRNFGYQLVVYVVINTMLWLIWLFSGGGGTPPWPVWVTVFWGVGIVMQAWRIYGSKPITEDDVEREMQRHHGVIDDDG